MTAYVIADIEVTDPEGFEEYKKLSGPAVEPYGGKYIARGGRVEALEGDWQPTRLVLLQFDSVEQAQRWWTSPEYEKAKAVRQKTANARFIVVEGL
jgi:uncharacterized protein (DUF1330 family)